MLLRVWSKQPRRTSEWALTRLSPDPAPEEAVRPYRWLIEAVGDGVALTSAGYLRPAMVTAAMTELGWEDRWIGRQNREDNTLPVLSLTR